MKHFKRSVSLMTGTVCGAAAVLSAAGAFFVPENAAAAVSYPVQEFRFGIYNTDRNITLSDTDSGSYLSSETLRGTSDEKWHLNYVSAGTYEIVNAANGYVITNDGGIAVAEPDTDAANQRWNITPVQNDYDGYALYYKVVSAADSSQALTFDVDSNSIAVDNYSGDGYQKFKLNLDGLEGFAANCTTSSGEKAGTIGGLLGETVFVSTADDLEAQLKTTEPKTIVVTADIDMQKKSHTRIRDNKTLVGCYGSHTIYDSYFRTNNEYGTEGDEPSDNIIIRNLKMVAKNQPNRILVNIWSSRQIWIDHIYFESQLSYDRTGNGQDEVGKFIWINTPYMSYMDKKDNGRSPDYITISYCHLKNRYWTVAYGTQNDEITRDRTTLLNNWWDVNVRRCPQLGNGSAHVYNNYYSAYGKDSNGSATSGIIGGDGSDIVSENNYFNGYTKSQALMMGGGPEPCRDSNSYLSEGLNATPSKVSFSPKTTSSWYPNRSNYGYSLMDAYNTSGTDSKAFCTKYAGDQTSASNMKYITDSEFSSWVTTKYASPFLKSITVGNEPVGSFKTGASFSVKPKYTIQNVNSKYYLEVAGAVAANGTDVQQGDTGARYWTLEDAGSGYYRIYSELGDGKTYLLDLDYGKKDNGTNIGIWSDTASNAQLFKFVPNDDGTYTITTRATRDASCLGVAAGSKDSGATVVQWACDESDNQKWIVEAYIPPINGKLFSNLIVEDLDTYDTWSINDTAAVGDAVYSDRDGVTYATLPEVLVGAEAITIACDAKNSADDLATFTAAEAITVYVAMDQRVTTTPAWLSGWTKTNLTATSSKDVTYILYQNTFAKGETVTLGTNGQVSGCVNYTVFAVPAEGGSVIGDANDDGAFTVLDVIMVQRYLLGSGKLTAWQNGDMNGDGIITAHDLTLMKIMLLAKN